MGRKRVRHAVRWPIGEREVVIKATAKLHQPGGVRAHRHPDRDNAMRKASRRFIAVQGQRC